MRRVGQAALVGAAVGLWLAIGAAMLCTANAQDDRYEPHSSIMGD